MTVRCAPEHRSPPGQALTASDAILGLLQDRGETGLAKSREVALQGPRCDAELLLQLASVQTSCLGQLVKDGLAGGELHRLCPIPLSRHLSRHVGGMAG
jgi:hypothetical protein